LLKIGGGEAGGKGWVLGTTNDQRICEEIVCNLNTRIGGRSPEKEKVLTV